MCFTYTFCCCIYNNSYSFVTIDFQNFASCFLHRKTKKYNIHILSDWLCGIKISFFICQKEGNLLIPFVKRKFPLHTYFYGFGHKKVLENSSKLVIVIQNSETKILIQFLNIPLGMGLSKFLVSFLTFFFTIEM